MIATMVAMPIADVTRELLVRYLDTWTPGALGSARRATFAQAWSGPADVGLAEAAVRVFAEFSDRLRGRRLTVVLVAPQARELAGRLEVVQAELGTPAEPDGHLMDISLSPHPGPLRRELLAHLGSVGSASVVDLRHFTLTETVFRASDTVRVLSALLSAGAVTREPERGRLSGDVQITVA